MILINLLPHREEKRRRRKQAFFAVLGFAALAGALVTQQERNAFLQSEIAKLDEQIKDIANLRAEIDALKARQRAVEDLQTDRNMPVHLLNELVKQTPEGVYLTSIRQDGQMVSVSGVAQTNERVSELLRNTAYNSPWLERPELIEIKAANVRAEGREQRRLFEFSMRIALKRPQDAAAAGAAPAPRASPAS
jgi:type IV pilus assembly protein PilN